MHKSMKLTAMTMGAILSLALTACGSSGGGDEGGGGKSDKRLDGVSLAVGSKDFTENILLGEMFAQAVEKEGASVDNKTNLGGTEVNRSALMSGDIDVYPEYNGTGWTVHLKQEDPSQDPAELFKVTSEKDLAENKIKWVGQSPFNDTYGFAANGDLAKKEGGFDLQGMADYLKKNKSAKVCLETEFPDRPDGLILFEKATGYKIPQSQQQILDTGLIYTETSDGKCDFGEVFTTDGRITALNLELVKDPGVFILYNASYTMKDAVYSAHSEVYDEVANKIFEGLTEEKMAELNAEVDVDGKRAQEVAKEYLKEISLV